MKLKITEYRMLRRNLLGQLYIEKKRLKGAEKTIQRIFADDLPRPENEEDDIYIEISENDLWYLSALFLT